MTTTCELCLKVKPSDRSLKARFCSKSCASKFMRINKKENLLGKEFGKYLVLREGKPYKTNNQSTWICLCKGCDREFTVTASNLKKGNCTQCKECSVRLKPYEALYNKLLYTAKVKDRECNINFDEFLQFTKTDKCFYCNAKVKWAKHSEHEKYWGYNLDRVNNSRDYYIDNVVVCCKRCNRGKSDTFSFNEWVCMTAALKNREVI